LGEEVALRRTSEETENVAAWALYQRAERARKSAEDLLLTDEGERAREQFLLADSLLEVAEGLDETWPGPSVLRAEIYLALAQVFSETAVELDEHIGLAMDHVARALSRDSRYAPALEKRGVLKYVRWYYGLEVDPQAAATLLEGAKEDLREATRIDSSRAYAWNILSRILSEESDPVGAKLAALRAWEEDAYLRDAMGLLWRLYATSYDLEQFSDAVKYCDEGQRRFPDYYRFVECQLWLLASRAMPPDVDRAWELYGRLEETLPETGEEYTRLKGKILVGAVLARAEMPDSAHVLWNASEGDAEMDPTRDLLALQAVFRLQNGEEREALDLIRTYMTLNPEHRTGWTWTSHWWWKDLRDNPEFQDILGNRVG
jgi:tetratricopeptide (TPR) repeat protein